MKSNTIVKVTTNILFLNGPEHGSQRKEPYPSSSRTSKSDSLRSCTITSNSHSRMACVTDRHRSGFSNSRLVSLGSDGLGTTHLNSLSNSIGAGSKFASGGPSNPNGIWRGWDSRTRSSLGRLNPRASSGGLGSLSSTGVCSSVSTLNRAMSWPRPTGTLGIPGQMHMTNGNNVSMSASYEPYGHANASPLNRQVQVVQCVVLIIHDSAVCINDYAELHPQYRFSCRIHLLSFHKSPILMKAKLFYVHHRCN